MKKLLILLLIPFLVGAAPSRQNTYTTGEVIAAADVTANEDAIFNYLTAGVDTIKDGSIVNADVSSSANIQTGKINLTAIGASTFTSTLTCSTTTNIGWTVVTGADTAGNTTCTNACIFGFDDDTDTIVSCDSALADRALCGGSS